VSAVSKSINAVLDDPLAREDADEAWSVWRDVESMLPRMFLPSPVTWLEQILGGHRVGIVLREVGGYFSLITVHEGPEGPFSLHLCDFRGRGILEPGERIEVVNHGLSEEVKDSDSGFDLMGHLGKIDPDNVSSAQLAKIRGASDLLLSRQRVLERKSEMLQAGIDVVQALNRFIGMAVLTLDLINTPGLIGLKQREIHKGLARDLSRVGRYPLLAWSEVVLKHQTRRAEPGERLSGATYHKCLHFVRSHLRHYRDGGVTVIPAHWRGDPALGIKRTRYRVAA
jgi:hypothetical protein